MQTPNLGCAPAKPDRSDVDELAERLARLEKVVGTGNTGESEAPTTSSPDPAGPSRPIYPPLDQEHRSHVGTAQLAYYLNRAEQTARLWACTETFDDVAEVWADTPAWRDDKPGSREDYVRLTITRAAKEVLADALQHQDEAGSGGASPSEIAEMFHESGFEIILDERKELHLIERREIQGALARDVMLLGSDDARDAIRAAVVRSGKSASNQAIENFLSVLRHAHKHSEPVPLHVRTTGDKNGVFTRAFPQHWRGFPGCRGGAPPLHLQGVLTMSDHPASPPPPHRTHAATCAAIATELQNHHNYLHRLLRALTESAEDAASKGRHAAVAELARTATSVQAGAARALAGLLSVEAEGRLAAAALGRGGPRGPLLSSSDVDAE